MFETRVFDDEDTSGAIFPEFVRKCFDVFPDDDSRHVIRQLFRRSDGFK